MPKLLATLPFLLAHVFVVAASILAILLLFSSIAMGQEDIEEGEYAPEHLTNMVYGRHNLWYMGRDQCMRRPGQQSIGSFGLLFTLDHGFMCEPEGILICYPGQLDARNTIRGVIPSMQYRVENIEDNEVAQRCEAKRAEFCAQNTTECKLSGTRTVPWHGILVETVDGGDRILIHLSISNHIYEFTSREAFWIQFGTWDNPRTKIRLPGKGKYLNFKEDRALHDIFMSYVEEGTLLSAYTGLWMLGLDVLPLERDDEVQLYIYRGCECSMHAWFTRPTDELDAQKPPLSIGHEQCDPAATNSVLVELDGVQEDSKVVMHVLIDQNASLLHIALLDRQNQSIWEMTGNQTAVMFGPPDHINQYNTLTSQVPSNEDGSMPWSWLQPGKELYLEIFHVHFHRFYYEVAVGNWPPVVIQMLWPIKWWEQLPFGNLNALRLEGDLHLLRQPELMRAGHTTAYIGAPYSKPLPLLVPVAEGTDVHIVIMGKVNAGASWFQINLMHDSREFHQFIGATLMRMHVNLTSSTITFNSYYGGQWTENRMLQASSNDDEFPFHPDEAFQCEIVARIEGDGGQSSSYNVTVNGPRLEEPMLLLTSNVKGGEGRGTSSEEEANSGFVHDSFLHSEEATNFCMDNLPTTTEEADGFDQKADGFDHHAETSTSTYTDKFPLWSLDWIQLDGQVELLNEPAFSTDTLLTNDSNTVNWSTNSKQFKQRNLLFPGQQICIEGHTSSDNSPDKNGNFEISLLYDAQSFSIYVGSIPLRMQFNYDVTIAPDKRFNVSSFVHGGSWTRPLNNQNPVDYVGRKFSIAIGTNATANNYMMRFDENLKNFFPYAANPQIPLSAVQWVQLKGHVKMMQNIPCKELFPNYAPLVPKSIERVANPETNPLWPGKMVSIKGTLGDLSVASSENISINFFHNALDWHPKFGSTIFQANISAAGTRLSFNCFLGGQWRVGNNESFPIDPPLQSGQQFLMNIVVKWEVYEVLLGEQQQKFTFEHSKWAAPPWAVNYIVVKGADGPDALLNMDSENAIRIS